MSNLPKLSDLDIISAQTTPSATPVMEVGDMETNRLKREYTAEMNITKTQISDKISELTRKLKKHELKESMLDRIITETYTELDNLGPNEFTRRGQKQTILIKQMEALGMLHDTILKYEDMTQKYFKIMMDIENNKLNSHIKIMNLNKEEKATDDQLGEVMKELQDMLNSGMNGASSNPMLDDIKLGLEKDGY